MVNCKRILVIKDSDFDLFVQYQFFQHQHEFLLAMDSIPVRELISFPVRELNSFPVKSQFVL